MNGSSGLVAAAADASEDLEMIFLAATFLTGAFLVLVFFAAILVATFLAAFLATRLVVAGVCGIMSSWVWLLIRNG